jgi:hypothetical protein
MVRLVRRTLEQLRSDQEENVQCCDHYLFR